MPDRSQKPSGRRSPPGESNPLKPGGHAARPGEKKDDLSSYDGAKKALLKKVWQAIPRRWRIPLAAVILIGGGLVASHSVWYPTVDAWINPPAQRLSLGGWVFLQTTQACANADVQLLNQQGGVVAIASTDATGFVSFNISSEDQIANVRCTDKTGSTTTLPFDTDVVAKGRDFRLFLDQNRIEYHEP